LGRFIFVQRVLDLRRRRVVINGLLQSLLFHAGLPQKIGEPVAATTALAATATAAAEPGKSAVAGSAKRLFVSLHFLNQRLNRVPVSVVGQTKLGADVVSLALLHLLLELGRVKISATTTAKTAAATATTAAAEAATATTSLRQKSVRAQTERGDHRARR
jgi:hypothetical protein